jgi:hypothetical protein
VCGSKGTEHGQLRRHYYVSEWGSPCNTEWVSSHISAAPFLCVVTECFTQIMSGKNQLCIYI